MGQVSVGVCRCSREANRWVVVVEVISQRAEAMILARGYEEEAEIEKLFLKLERQLASAWGFIGSGYGEDFLSWYWYWQHTRLLHGRYFHQAPDWH